jgi:hypothetical protein
MFQDGLQSFLTAQPLITALLGTSRSDLTKGVFPMLAVRQATLPYLVYQRVGGKPAYSYQGANRWQDARFRFSCYAASQRGSVLLAEAIKLVFAMWTGTLPDGTPVQNVMLELEADDAESIPNGTIFAVHLDYSFQYLDQF